MVARDGITNKGPWFIPHHVKESPIKALGFHLQQRYPESGRPFLMQFWWSSITRLFSLVSIGPFGSATQSPTNRSHFSASKYFKGNYAPLLFWSVIWKIAGKLNTYLFERFKWSQTAEISKRNQKKEVEVVFSLSLLYCIILMINVYEALKSKPI